MTEAPLVQPTKAPMSPSEAAVRPPIAHTYRDNREKSKLTKEEWREYTKTVWQVANVTHPNHPAPFPLELPHRLVKLFSLYNDIILDPFAGIGTTARAAISLGRRAICIEQNSDYIEILKREVGTTAANILEEQPLQVFNGDSRNLDFIPSDSVDLVVTSPPYWNKADYGDGSANIGNTPQYRKFLSDLQPVFAECFRVLSPGRKICIITAYVNQYTDYGLLTFPLATDFNILLREIGFVMTAEIIWNKDGTGGKWGSFGAQRPIFGSYPYPPNFLFKNVHEYILVWEKPSRRNKPGKKALPYEWVMQQ